MKKDIRFLFQALLPLLLACSNLAGQGLHVYYDLFNDSISYRRDGLEVKNPKIRKGERIMLHFTEYNPYLYQGEVTVEQNNNENYSGGSSLGAIQGLVPGFSQMVPSLGMLRDSMNFTSGLSSFFNLPVLKVGEKSLEMKDLFSSSRGTDQLLVQAQAQLQQLAQTQSEMAEAYEELQRMEQSNQAAQLALNNFDRLIVNPRIRPSLIKKNLMEYHRVAFPGKTPDSPQLTDAFERQTQAAAKERMLATLQSKQQTFDMQMEQLTPITRALSDLDLGDPKLDQFTGELRSLNQQGKVLKQKVSDYVRYEQSNTGSSLTLPQTLSLQEKFHELSDQDFTYTCSIQAEQDQIVVNAKFTPHDTLPNGARQGSRSSSTKVIKLETRGGWRINTAFGVGFARFFDAAQEFSVRENTIVADDAGIVQPALTTMMHFYTNNPRGATLAGTFGIGIPMTGNDIGAISFYLGPSLLFGRSQRIVLSGGLMTGPVKRLARGLNAGDPFDLNDGDIPVKSRYELGYFLGLSFNLTN